MFGGGCNAFKLTLPAGTFRTWVRNLRRVGLAQCLLLECGPCPASAGC